MVRVFDGVSMGGIQLIRLILSKMLVYDIQHPEYNVVNG